VAPRLERQEVDVAGALEATEDDPVVDEGASAIPAPVQVPHTPPPVTRLARNMAHRLARVEEDVHEIRGALGEKLIACSIVRRNQAPEKVAPRLERQEVDVAGALEATEDDLVVNEGASAIPAPVQVPHTPPPVTRLARNMAHRLARVEEDVHEIRGALGEKYTNYAEFQIPYVRCTRRKTVDASTSIAQEDEQPDP
nr:hypothetical protein [Tanacetum cinerariifolium]